MNGLLNKLAREIDQEITLAVITEIDKCIALNGATATIQLVTECNDPSIYMLPTMIETREFFKRMKWILTQEQDGHIYLSKK